jgi:transcription termination factor NusB
MSGVSTNKLEIYAEELYYFSSMEKFAFVRKNPNGKWEVVSKKGKPLGEFDTKTKAVKRLRQIEFFKHKKAATENPSLSYSAIIRLLNKEYDTETVRNFQRLFKENFDRLYLEGDESPEETALEVAIKSVEHFHKNANAIEMGDSTFAGKRLSDLVKFLLRRIPDGKRPAAIQAIKKKLYMLNEYEISRKSTPSHSSMGQAITIVKNILLEHNPQYIRNVLNALVKNL